MQFSYLNTSEELYGVAEVTAQFRYHVTDGSPPLLIHLEDQLGELALQEVLHFLHLLPTGSRNS